DHGSNQLIRYLSLIPEQWANLLPVMRRFSTLIPSSWHKRSFSEQRIEREKKPQEYQADFNLLRCILRYFIELDKEFSATNTTGICQTTRGEVSTHTAY